METRRALRWAGRGLAGGMAGLASGYAVWVTAEWLRYGRPASSRVRDQLLDRFLPRFEVFERHHIRVAAPGEIAFATAVSLDMQQSMIVRSIFRAREMAMGSRTGASRHPRALLDQMKSIGWSVLAEVPGREIVLGCVTQPWLADVTFRPLTPAEFVSFSEPEFVKIAWTLQADPAGSGASVVSTETRVLATDEVARSKLRLYWPLVAPGVVVIRRMILRVLKKEAERRAKWQMISTAIQAG